MTEPTATEPHLLLVDGLNIVRPIYETNPAPDSPEKMRKVTKTIWQSLFRGLKEHAPTHFLMVFDGPNPTWRHEMFPEYKTGRSPMPEELRNALPSLKDSLNACGLRNVTTDGYEAEDYIYTLALRAFARGYRVTVLSNDKDLCTLLQHGVSVFNHFNSIHQDHAWLRAKFGIAPEQLQDFLALWGDTSDGIPGVNKVGEKTAAKLLGEHGSLEGVLAAAQGQLIKGVVGENLRIQADQARLARKLVELSADAPISVRPSELRLPDTPAIR